jgi:hypothetical protein
MFLHAGMKIRNPRVPQNFTARNKSNSLLMFIISLLCFDTSLSNNKVQPDAKRRAFAFPVIAADGLTADGGKQSALGCVFRKQIGNAVAAN